MWMILLVVILLIILIARYFALKYLKSQNPLIELRTVTHQSPVFPQGFIFAVSTAAYQIEENIPPSNWSDWATKTKPNGEPRCPKDDDKCCGLKFFKEDVSLMKNINFQIYRFSISWSRINPTEGVFDSDALQIYIDQCTYLRSNNIEPLVTLWHFEHPLWVEKKGGLLSPDYPSYFEQFVNFVVPKLKGSCIWFHTLNEPCGYSFSAMFLGLFPPGYHGINGFATAVCTLFKCHVKAYDIIKKHIPHSRVSFAKNMIPFMPLHQWSLFEHFIAHYFNDYNRDGFIPFYDGKFRIFWKNFFMPELIGKLDFISINHYYCGYISLNPFDWVVHDGQRVILTNCTKRGLDVSDFGWGLIPNSLTDTIRWVNTKFNPKKLPIMVTEHGIADGNDLKRPKYLSESLSFLAEGIHFGLPVIGYTIWTLYDNYEWAEGFKMKFGLFAVDRETKERSPRKSSVDLIKDIILKSQTAE